MSDGITDAAKQTKQAIEKMRNNLCRNLSADMDAYDDWYMTCECGEEPSEEKCIKGLKGCDYFERGASP